MPARRRAKEVLLSHYERRIARGELAFLFIVSHMRSGSTLLVHILATSPEVDGFGESHLTYVGTRDLARLSVAIRRSFRRMRLNGRYLMDKIVFDYITDVNLLKHRNVKIIFLVRRPEETLPSIMRFRPAFEDWDEERALEYYLVRLRTMAAFAREINDPSRTYWVTYDQLTGKTQVVLRSLERFLELEQPLTEEYGTMWSTGRRLAPERSGHVRGVGDNSENIKSGRVLRQQRHQPAVHISPGVLNQAREGFDRCLDALARSCSSCRELGAEADGV